MEIEIKIEEVIWGVEEMVYYGTHSSNTKSRQKDENMEVDISNYSIGGEEYCQWSVVMDSRDQ